MAQPVWVTPAGDLGTIPEGVFYQTPLEAYDPGLDTVYYSLLAGALPAGMFINDSGMISGIPQAKVSIQGVPEPVSRDVTSKFAVRAYTQQVIQGVTVINRLADRTFEITVSGQDAPEFVTPAGQIAQVYDGTLFDFQIEYTDVDPDDIVTVKLISGSLPSGLSITPQGLISGFVNPLSPINALAGFSRDGQGFSQYPFDFSTQGVNANYQFTLEVTDGKVGGSNLRTFSIYVWSRSIMTADTTFVTADNTFITADVSPVRIPILLNPQGSIGRVRNDNWFAYKFNALDLDGDLTQFIISSSSPTALPGLTLDLNTGWLYGYIPNLGLTDRTYTFDVRVYKKDNIDQISDPYTYSLEIIGPVDTEVTWLTDSDLGTINNGDISTLYVEAVVGDGQPLIYELLSGSDSTLPQGLSLLPSGQIAGRVSFNTFAVDLGTTTFDVEYLDTPTTFDMKNTFTVRAFSSDGLVDVTKTFYITVIRRYNEPYDNLYIQAMPPQDDRDLLDSLLQNSEIFPTDLIYRPDDPYFGVAKNVVYYHAYGLTAATLLDYVNSLDLNHYWKNLVLGEVEVAQARNSAGEIIYEAVYSRIIDNLVNNQGESVSKDVTLPYPIRPGDSTEITTVYPNSLINMRDQVIDVVGQISNVLPAWMTSKQTDGRVLGFIPAWVMAYAKPGKGAQIAYYIAEKFGARLNLVDYEVDRYELDRFLSHNWDANVIVLDIIDISGDGNTVTVTYNEQAIPPALPGNNIVISGVNPSSYNGGYDVITCSTTQITFQSINTSAYVAGGKLTVPEQWIPPPAQTYFDNGITDDISAWGNYNPTYTVFTPVQWVNVAGNAVTWTNSYNGEQTVFDGNSLKFIDPVDMYVGLLPNPQIYDKYLVFPKRNIIE